MTKHSSLCLGACLTLLGACGVTLTSPRSTETRLVQATLIPPASTEDALGGTRSIQLMAVEIVGGVVQAIYGSTPVDPRTVQRLQVAVPKNVPVSLFVQTPKGSQQSLGVLAGVIQWSDGQGRVTGRLLRSDADVDLGELRFETGSPASLADNRLTVASASNPYRRSDQDQDGTADFDDTDDDADGSLDAQDTDADGDGIKDTDWTLAALADANGTQDGDGVPDDSE